MTYFQLQKLSNYYYNTWTSDGIDEFHTDVEEITAWLKRADLYTGKDVEISELAEEDIEKIADIISEKVKEELENK